MSKLFEIWLIVGLLCGVVPVYLLQFEAVITLHSTKKYLTNVQLEITSQAREFSNTCWSNFIKIDLNLGKL